MIKCRHRERREAAVTTAVDQAPYFDGLAMGVTLRTELPRIEQALANLYAYADEGPPRLDASPADILRADAEDAADADPEQAITVVD
jgi:hypothetical protein